MMVLRVLTIVSCLAAPLAAAWEDNQCVQCHESQNLPISLGHSFDEWRASSHARAGIGCEKCHGGDASATDQSTAHRNVEPASDVQSMVHTSRLVTTCGTCHPKEREAYEQTVHARQVSDRQGGATCSTCHGSMATSLPSPADLRSRCAVCHDKPVLAQEALSVLAAAKVQLFRTRRAIQAVGDKDAEWYAGTLQRFHKMEQAYGEISMKWHTFAMKEVLGSSRDLLKLAKLLDEEVKLRTKMDQ
jgi:hypothetical protein